MCLDWEIRHVPFSPSPVSPSTSPVKKTASHAIVTSKSNPERGFPLTITTVASPLKLFIDTNFAVNLSEVVGGQTNPTTISVTRDSAHAVWFRSSHVPAVFQLDKPLPPLPAS